MNFLDQIIPISMTFLFFFLCSQHKQLLSALLILEMMMIFIIFLMTLVSSKTSTELFYIMIMLTFAATEASLGLAILVSMMRSYGSDTLNSKSAQKC